MIEDPLFYVLAFFAVVINGIAKSGLGGGLGVMSVPLMSLVISPVQAAAIMLPILIAMDMFGLYHYRKKFHRQNLKLLLPFTLLGIAFGWWAFNKMNEATVLILVGGIAIIFTLNRFIKQNIGKATHPHVVTAGFWGTLSGFVSTLVHAGGPPINIYLLPQKLDKTIFIGTTVTLFTVVNLVKLVPYYFLDQFNSDNLLTSLVLMPLAPLGIWVGIKIHGVVNEKWFYRICYTFLFITGVKLLTQGLQAISHLLHHPIQS